MPDSNEKYLKLITSEYADKPNYNKFVETFLSKVSPINDIYNKIQEIFNIDVAVGDQLDKIGQILGISRELPISNDDIPSVLPDNYYRQVLKSRIYSNMWDGTIKGLTDIIAKVFPNISWQLVDNQDMTMQIVIIYPDEDKTMLALLTNGYILPKPSGVGLGYTIQKNKLFAWDTENSFLGGWDSGYWN